MTEHRSFPNAPESVAAARRFAVATVPDLAGEAAAAIKLMVSEVATNCVRHTGSDFEMTITRSPTEVRVEISDGSASQPQLLSPDHTEPHGRGLLIVDALSADWGVRPRAASGKTVWFTLALNDPPAAA